MKCWGVRPVTQEASRRSIDVLVADGYRVKQCTRVLGVSSQGYYKYRLRPLAPTKMRREWLTGITRDIHVASRGTYGYRRHHAELTQAHGVFVSANLVNLLIHNAAIAGLPGPGGASRNSGVPTDDDLVNRRFNRDGLNELWNLNSRREGLLLRCFGHVQSQNCGLVYRLCSGFTTSCECPRYGDKTSNYC